MYTFTEYKIFLSKHWTKDALTIYKNTKSLIIILVITVILVLLSAVTEIHAYTNHGCYTTLDLLPREIYVLFFLFITAPTLFVHLVRRTDFFIYTVFKKPILYKIMSSQFNKCQTLKDLKTLLRVIVIVTLVFMMILIGVGLFSITKQQAFKVFHRNTNVPIQRVLRCDEM